MTSIEKTYNFKNNSLFLNGEELQLANSNLLSVQKGKDNLSFTVKYGGKGYSTEIFLLKVLNTGKILFSPNGEFMKQDFIKIKGKEIIIDKIEVKNPKLIELKEEIVKSNIKTYEIDKKLEEMGDFYYGLSEEVKIHFENEGITTTDEFINNKKDFIKRLTIDSIEMNKTFIKLNYSDIETYKKQIIFVEELIKKNKLTGEDFEKMQKEIENIKKNIQELKENIKELKKK